MTEKEYIKSLIRIEGIGKVSAKHLIQAGIKGPEELENADAEKINKEIIKLSKNGKIKYKDSKKAIETWIEEAKKKNYLYTYAKEKYYNLFERTFEDKLRFILYENLIIKKVENLLIDENILVINNNTIKKFKDDYKDMADVRERNEKIDQWINKNKSKVGELKNLYKEEFKKNLKLEQFKEFYGQDNDKRQCEYCKITESQISELIQNERIVTKRIYSRGRKMEVDRKEPNGLYTLSERNKNGKFLNSNIVLSCYWCNNAKTDEFSYEEFKKVGKVFEQIWKERLEK